MQKKLILRTHANEIFETILKIGLNPSNFQWQEHDSETSDGDYYKVSKLVHQPTGYYFIFDYDYNRHFATRSPGNDCVVESKRTEYWAGQKFYADEWLKILKCEIEAPDFWGAVTQERELAEVAIASQTPNTPFTVDEQKYIISRIFEIEEYAKASFNLTEEQITFFKTRLDYLAESAQRQGRRDWLHTSIGILFTIVIGIGLAPEQARELFRFVASALKQLFSGILPMP